MRRVATAQLSWVGEGGRTAAGRAFELDLGHPQTGSSASPREPAAVGWGPRGQDRLPSPRGLIGATGPARRRRGAVVPGGSCLWEGRLPDVGNTAVADGLAMLADTGPHCIIGSHRTGLAVEAAAAEHSRGRRSGGEYQVIRERATGLLDRIRSALGAGHVLTPVLAAGCSTAGPVVPSPPRRATPDGGPAPPGRGKRSAPAVGVRPLAAGRGHCWRREARRRPRGPGPGLDAGQHARRCPARRGDQALAPRGSSFPSPRPTSRDGTGPSRGAAQR